jgi:tetratricopeptide (TPR) repeat protein
VKAPSHLQARLGTLAVALVVALVTGVATWRARSTDAVSVGAARPPETIAQVAQVPPSAPVLAPSASAPVAAAAVPATTPTDVASAATTASASAAAPATPGPSASSPEAPSFRTLLARGRSELRAGNASAAREAFLAAVARSPSDSEALTGLAEADRIGGSLAVARAEYERALKANSDYFPARIGLADVEWALGQHDEARAAYAAIVDRYPTELVPARAIERARAH